MRGSESLRKGEGMSSTKPKLKEMIREGVRATVRNTLAAAIQEVTEEELRTALREPAFKEPLMEMVRLELQQAIEELRPNGKPRSRQSR